MSRPTPGRGFRQLPTAINMPFDGRNVGKLIVKMTR
jgi:NADPH-dependent curcumin reductase CurA